MTSPMWQPCSETGRKYGGWQSCCEVSTFFFRKWQRLLWLYSSTPFVLGPRWPPLWHERPRRPRGKSDRPSLLPHTQMETRVAHWKRQKNKQCTQKPLHMKAWTNIYIYSQVDKISKFQHPLKQLLGSLSLLSPYFLLPPLKEAINSFVATSNMSHFFTHT